MRLTVVFMLIVSLAFVTASQCLPPNVVGLPVILVDDRRPAHKQSILYLPECLNFPLSRTNSITFDAAFLIHYNGCCLVTYGSMDKKNKRVPLTGFAWLYSLVIQV